MTTAAPRPLRVALGEYDIGWHDPETSLARASEVAGDAVAAGARLVVLPEMVTTGFTMDVSQATPLAGGHSARLAAIAAQHGVWMIASVAATEPASPAEAIDANRAVNAALVIDPSGRIIAVYRKQKLFAFAGEHQHYAPGDGTVTVNIDGVRVAPLVCYDLRFPELFRAVARTVDAFVLVANWPAARRPHWDVLTHARAIENQAYVVAVNRIGHGGALAYDGGSVVWDPWGEIPPATFSSRGIRIVDVDPKRVAEIRRQYPFLDDLSE